MAKPLFSFNIDVSQATRTFRKFPKAADVGLRRGILKAATELMQRARKDTPVGRTTKARGAWDVKATGSAVEITNDAPHIGRLELGGYPGQGPKTIPGGNYGLENHVVQLRGADISKPGMRSFVSDQAKRGMLRNNAKKMLERKGELSEVEQIIEEEINLELERAQR